ncbi:MAG: glycoside hydrolase family 1 protein [Candidatus Daviesbacteria bacterium]|nr:glycoside hydrolase family 1 protein [Candidatus Daviesbacteria bacterium]
MADVKVPPKHDHTPLIFPEGFLWGSATSSHQVEGNNIHSDWWDWESKSGHEKSGEACDQYNRYEEDFKLIKDLHQNAHRLSIEWARIEPSEGVFDQNEINHYIKTLTSLKSRNIKVMLTLHHFTLPLWVSKKGGWSKRKSAWYFERFVKKIVPELKDYVDFWITINEPEGYVWCAYIGAKWPPQKKSKWLALKTNWNLVRAHKKAYRVIHQIVPHAKVGMAQNVQSYTAYHKHSFREQLGVIISDLSSNHLFYFLSRGTHDFLGLNYYFHYRLKEDGGLIPEVTNVRSYTKEVSDLGWEIFPEGMFDILTDMADGLPIYITECGIATSNDDRRIRFVMQYLQEVYRAIAAGVKVKGFFYWSLLDNFEWADGFDPKFGLIEVDFKTQKRTVRPSAEIYADIAKNNGIRHELMKFLGHRIHVTDVIEIPK